MKIAICYLTFVIISIVVGFLLTMTMGMILACFATCFGLFKGKGTYMFVPLYLMSGAIILGFAWWFNTLSEEIGRSVGQWGHTAGLIAAGLAALCSLGMIPEFLRFAKKNAQEGMNGS